jgi:tyrosine-protein kinase Etk/Wzc
LAAGTFDTTLPPAIPEQLNAGSPWLISLQLTLRWRRLVAGVTAGVVVLGGIVVLLLPNRYTATAVLLPPHQSVSESSALLSQLSSMGALGGAAAELGLKNPNDQQVALLRSRTVEDAIVERFHLQALYHARYLSSARKVWETKSSADSGLKDGLIRVSVTDSDPHRAAQLANAWVDEYRDFSSTLAISEASQRRLFYQKELEAAHLDLVKAEDAMEQTQKRTGVIDLEGQDRSMIASAAVLRGQLAAKKIEIRGMHQFAAPGNPDLQRAEQEAAGLETQLAAMDADANRRSGDLVAPRGSVTQASLDYLRALREVRYRETIQDLLTRQYEGARVDEAREGPLIQVVEPAVPPDTPSHYKRWLLLAAILLAFPLGLGAAWCAHSISTLRRKLALAGSWTEILEQLAGDRS